ncbi:MAG: terpene cyclase/mutase family protein, partial [Actinomycetota bacterium]|nr:terpene cyclase/mutase family protein [Actinomycetota bacterium]
MFRLTRPAALLASFLATLAAAGIAGAAPAASAAPAAPTPAVRAAAAAGWLARQFLGGDHLQSCFGTQCFPDYGLTADAVLGLASTHSAGTAITQATGWLAANAASYIGASDGTGPYPGAYAKLALVAETTGNDPHAFGGVNLLAALRALECPHVGCPGAATAGEFRNTLTDGGFPNVVTQSLAIVALTRSTRSVDHQAVPAAASFLAGQQCSPTGGFPTFFDSGGACVADVDATAFAVQALLAAGAAPTGAVDWLAAQRQPSGGFAAGGVTNTNTTGVAVQALSAAGRDTAISQVYVSAQQLGCTATPADRGAISFSGPASFKPATAQRATPQAIFAFTRVPYAALSAAGAAPGAAILTCATASPPPTPTPSASAPAPSP